MSGWLVVSWSIATVVYTKIETLSLLIFNTKNMQLIQQYTDNNNFVQSSCSNYMSITVFKTSKSSTVDLSD